MSELMDSIAFKAVQTWVKHKLWALYTLSINQQWLATWKVVGSCHDARLLLSLLEVGLVVLSDLALLLLDLLDLGHLFAGLDV